MISCILKSLVKDDLQGLIDIYLNILCQLFIPPDGASLVSRTIIGATGCGCLPWFDGLVIWHEAISPCHCRMTQMVSKYDREGNCYVLRSEAIKSKQN
ncbi:hypothetical protein QQP08_005547 [Theobroma cacao]|nr:hypothetical protein QQP08_005547 [Theobroma cacao]